MYFWSERRKAETCRHVTCAQSGHQRSVTRVPAVVAIAAAPRVHIQLLTSFVRACAFFEEFFATGSDDSGPRCATQRHALPAVEGLKLIFITKTGTLHTFPT
jgi:hypothetical protein